MHWSDLMRQRLLKCDKAQAAGYEPEWDGLAELDCVGGADGLIILEELMHEDYRDYVWDLARWQREGGRLHPLRHEHPSKRCAWNLQAMRDECEQRGFPDQELVFDIYTWGQQGTGPGRTPLRTTVSCALTSSCAPPCAMRLRRSLCRSLCSSRLTWWAVSRF